MLTCTAVMTRDGKRCNGEQCKGPVLDLWHLLYLLEANGSCGGSAMGDKKAAAAKAFLPEAMGSQHVLGMNFITMLASLITMFASESTESLQWHLPPCLCFCVSPQRPYYNLPLCKL